MNAEQSTSGSPDRAAISSADEASVRQLLARMRAAWERGDGAAFGALFSEDARYVTAPGERLVGRRAIAESHRRVFASVLRNTHLGRNYPVQLQPITSDVVLIHAAGAVLFPREPEADVAPNGLMTIVAARRGGGWQFVSFNNTPTGRWRNIRFLWRYLASRTGAFRAEWSKAREYMLEEKRRNIASWREASSREATGRRGH